MMATVMGMATVVMVEAKLLRMKYALHLTLPHATAAHLIDIASDELRLALGVASEFGG